MKILIILFFNLIFYDGISQISHVEVLLGQSDSFVIKYFDSLNSLKPNPSYHIKRTAADNGDLVLTASFATSDEYFYTCSIIIARFFRSAGVEYCNRQVIGGSVEFAQPNLSFIKDNYTKASEGVWERTYAKGWPYKDVIEFKSGGGHFSIDYNLENVK